MRRRGLLIATTLSLAGLSLAGCGLSERPFAEKRTWPLVARRPTSRTGPAKGRILLVRTIEAAPGLGARGLQSLRPDGSLRIEFYDEWAVPPAESVESALRAWLADAGLFAAVVAPGSRLAADLVLEGTLTAFLAEPAAGRVRAALALVLIDQRPSPAKILMQRSFTAERPLAADEPPAIAAALTAALADLFGQMEAALRDQLLPARPWPATG